MSLEMFGILKNTFRIFKHKKI